MPVDNIHMRAALEAMRTLGAIPRSIGDAITDGMVAVGLLQEGQTLDDARAYAAMMVGRYYGELVQLRGVGTPRSHFVEQGAAHDEIGWPRMADAKAEPPKSEASLTVDPSRRVKPDLHGATGVYVRAMFDGRWISADIAELDGPSLLAWLRSRGGDNPWAEDVVGILLGHGQLHGTQGELT